MYSGKGIWNHSGIDLMYNDCYTIDAVSLSLFLSSWVKFWSLTFPPSWDSCRFWLRYALFVPECDFLRNTYTLHLSWPFVNTSLNIVFHYYFVKVYYVNILLGYGPAIYVRTYIHNLSKVTRSYEGSIRQRTERKHRFLSPILGQKLFFFWKKFCSSQQRQKIRDPLW